MPDSKNDAAGPVPVLALRVPNDRTALEPTRRAMLAFVGPDGIAADARYRLELVLEEVLMNFVLHAHPPGGRHHLELMMRRHPRAVEFVFDDDGVAFDPLHDAPPARADGEGGRGIALARKRATAWDYVRHDGRNRSTITIALDDRDA